MPRRDLTHFVKSLSSFKILLHVLESKNLHCVINSKFALMRNLMLSFEEAVNAVGENFKISVWK